MRLKDLARASFLAVQHQVGLPVVICWLCDVSGVFFILSICLGFLPLVTVMFDRTRINFEAEAWNTCSRRGERSI